MLAPYRISALPEPERTDEADAYESALRVRASRHRRAAVALTAAALVAGIALVAHGRHRPSRYESVATPRTAARLAHARETFARARAAAEHEQLLFASAMLAAIDAPPGAGGEACKPFAAKSELDTSSFPLLVVPSGDRELPSPSLTPFLREIRSGEESLDAGDPNGLATADRVAARMDAGPLSRYDVVVVTTAVKHPVRTSPTTFQPGEIRGRAFLYDFGQRRVRCAGDVSVTSSSQIEYSYNEAAMRASLDRGPRLSASLDSDLDRQLRHAIVDGALLLKL